MFIEYGIKENIYEKNQLKTQDINLKIEWKNFWFLQGIN